MRLADALQQPRTAGAGLTLLAGTFLTNNQPVRLRSLLSNPLPGTAPAARALRLGTSTVEITAGNWTITQPASLAFDAGTSTIFLSTGTFFNGNGFTYNTVQLGPGVLHVVGGNSTIATLLLAGVNLLTGSNTITSQLTLEPGSTFRFGAGTTTTFAAAASVQASGTGTRVITLQSTANGQAFIWSKPASATPAGTVCASFIYLRDSQAQGGAYFETGQQANNQGNTSGWSFGSLPQAGCPQPAGVPAAWGAHAALHVHGARPAHPAAHYAGGGAVPAHGGAAQPHGRHQPDDFRARCHLRPPDTHQHGHDELPGDKRGHQQRRLQLPGQCRLLSGGDRFAPEWPGRTVDRGRGRPRLAGLPELGQRHRAHRHHQRDGGRQPADARAEQPRGSRGHPARAARRPANPGQRRRACHNRRLAEHGTTTLDPASQVSFVGNTTQVLAGGAFGRAVVNNPAGLVLQTDAGTATSLTLTAGLVTTGSYKWWHANPAATSLATSGSASYVVGTLRRSIADGVSATYAFPVGTAGQYARLDLLSSQLVGTSFLDARFGAKTDSDAGLSCTETTPSPLRYLAVYPAGIWTLTPDAQPAGGTYDLQASLMPFADLVDNEFGLLRRPDTSLSATDWSAGGGSLSPGNGAGRRVADGYALRSSLRTFGQFGLGQAKSMAPLPVTLVSFQAVARGQAALLTWTTAQEINNDHFEVEASPDGQVFTLVKRVPGHGSSTVAHTYRFTDEQLPNYGAKLVYYRLRQVDANGSSQLSAVRTVAAIETADAFAVYPSLLAPGEPLHYALGEAVAAQAAGARLLLYSLTGQCLATHVLAAGATGSIGPTRLLPGWYLARLRLANGRVLAAGFGVQ